MAYQQLYKGKLEGKRPRLEKCALIYLVETYVYVPYVTKTKNKSFPSRQEWICSWRVTERFKFNRCNTRARGLTSLLQTHH